MAADAALQGPRTLPVLSPKAALPLQPHRSHGPGKEVPTGALLRSESKSDYCHGHPTINVIGHATLAFFPSPVRFAGVGAAVDA